MAVARSSSDDSAIRYVLRAVRMTRVTPVGRILKLTQQLALHLHLMSTIGFFIRTLMVISGTVVDVCHIVLLYNDETFPIIFGEGQKFRKFHIGDSDGCLSQCNTSKI